MLFCNTILAGLMERALAFLLDFVCLVFSLFILGILGTGHGGCNKTGVVFVVIFVFIISFFYSLAMEMLNDGKRIGKIIPKIQVIKVSGGQATFSDYAARWVFGWSISGFHSVQSHRFLSCHLQGGQRIGDVVANTAVVKVQPQMDLKIFRTISPFIGRMQNPPQFSGSQKTSRGRCVKLIKSTLDRYRKFRNDAHEEAHLYLMAERVKKILDIENPPV